MKKVVLFAISFLLVSCAMGSIKQKQEYYISPYFNIYSPVKTEKTVLVRSITTDEKFNTNLIYYKVDQHKIGHYAFSRWRGTPSDMFKNCLINSLNKSKLFKLAYTDSNYPIPDYVLEFSIIDLEPIFNDDIQYVAADIHFSLFSYKSHKLISEYEFSKKMPIDKIDLKNIVNIVNNLVRDSVLNTVKWLIKNLKSKT